MRKFVMAALVAMVSVHAGAQQPGTATLYSRGHFAGSSITITGPRTRMSPFDVRSLRIPPGSVWELCIGNTFTGCERYTQSKSAMIRTVRSVRPVAAPIPESVRLPSQATVSGSGPSLRGLASEFFVVPSQGSSRVEVTDKTPGAASRAALEFCRGRGWRMSAYERVQSVSGRTFLADVLCANEDR